MNLIDKSVRLSNFMVDYIIIFILWITFAVISQDQDIIYFGYFLFSFLYYLISEVIFNRTVGKILTGTIVVKKNGGKASFMNILLRTSLRLVPLDAFSFLFGTERGLHDVLSSTRIVELKMLTKK